MSSENDVRNKISKLAGTDFEGDEFRRESGRDPEKELADWQLMREKLRLMGSQEAGDREAKQVLGLSELEAITINILKRLNALPDSDPELLQLKSVFGVSSRLKIARRLAELSYNKKVAERLLNKYTDPAEVLEAGQTRAWQARQVPEAVRAEFALGAR